MNSHILDNVVKGGDSSLTIYNEEYSQSYHSKSMGAYSESMIKHIFPAMCFLNGYFLNKAFARASFARDFDLIADDFCAYFYSNWDLLKSYRYRDFFNGYFGFSNHSAPNSSANRIFSHRPSRILDICFGLGYNAMCAAHSIINCEIYSPEKDCISYLKDFNYSNLPNTADIIESLSAAGVYRRANGVIYFYKGDALDYIDAFPKGFFDIVFQDPFSVKSNPELWSREYFEILHYVTARDCIVATYAKSRVFLDNAKAAGFIARKYKYGSLLRKLD